MKRTGLRRKPAKVLLEAQRQADLFRTTVTARAEGKSQITGAYEWPMDPHHCVKRQVLKRIAPDQEWEPDCGILLTRTEHARHHNRGIVIRYEQLPDYVKRWAAAHDLTDELLREHPRREP